MRGRIILHPYRCRWTFYGVNMDKIGIIKEIDSLGRLQIPKEIRK